MAIPFSARSMLTACMVPALPGGTISTCNSTGTRACLRRSRFINARTERKFAFVRSSAIGLYRTKWAPCAKVPFNANWPSTMATMTARLFAGADRAALSAREASWFVQSTITASKRCRVIFWTAESGSRQCSTPISNSLSTRRSTRTTLSSSHRSKAWRPGCTVFVSELLTSAI